jgi:hypothetical protein
MRRGRVREAFDVIERGSLATAVRGIPARP